MNFKKILCLGLAALMLSCSGTSVLADSTQTQAELLSSSEATVNGVVYEYDTDNNTAVAKSLSDTSATTIKIAATANGYPVVAIAEGFCSYNSTVTEIDFTDATNLTTIGDNAFYYCTALDTVTEIENTQLLKVGASVFALTPFMAAQTDEFVMLASVLVKYNGDASEVTIPETVTAIADAFFGKDITSIDLGSVKYIGNNAFYGCRSLTEITLPATCTEIGDMTFAGCTLLSKVSYAGGLEKIGFNAFANCTALTSFENTAETPSVLSYIGECAFWNCKKLGVLELGSIETVNVGSFWNCFGSAADTLSYYRVPTSVKTIDEGGYGNLAFTYITVPDTVESIASAAFGSADSNTTYVTLKGSAADTYFASSSYESVNYGDMDKNGTITAVDIRTVENYIATGVTEDMTADSGNVLLADGDGDGKITLHDIYKIFSSIKEAYEAEQSTEQE